MAATYTSLLSTTTTSAASTVTVENIPSTYTSLVVVVRTYSTWTSDNGTRINMRFNGVSTDSYSTTAVEANGSTIYNERQSGAGVSYIWVGRNNNNNGGNTQKSTTIINIENYSNTTGYKTAFIRWGARQNQRPIGMSTGTWRSNNAINSISFFTDANMAAGTEIEIYGILAA